MTWINDAITKILTLNETVFMMIIFITMSILFVIYSASKWMMFKKAGVPGWVVFVPLLNIYYEYDISWYREFGLLYNVLAFIFSVTSMSVEDRILGGQAEAAGLVILFIMAVLETIKSYKMSKAFGHGMKFAVGLVLLPMVFYPILGFGKSTYIGKQ